MKLRRFLKTVAKGSIFYCRPVREAIKNVVLEPLASALGVAAVLHK
jgi:hypothetical protein